MHVCTFFLRANQLCMEVDFNTPIKILAPFYYMHAEPRIHGANKMNSRIFLLFQKSAHFKSKVPLSNPPGALWR